MISFVINIGGISRVAQALGRVMRGGTLESVTQKLMKGGYFLKGRITM